MTKNQNVQTFPLGHSLYPEGAVVVTEYGEVDGAGNVTAYDPPVTTEYTRDEWDALQQ